MLHATPYLFIMQDTGASQPSAPSPGTASAAAVPQPPSYQTVTSPHYAVVNYSQKTSPGGTSTGSTSGGALSQRSSKSSNRTGSSGSVGVTGVGNDSREPTPPPIPPHPPSEVNDNQNNHVTTNMQPIPQVSRWSVVIVIVVREFTGQTRLCSITVTVWSLVKFFSFIPNFHISFCRLGRCRRNYFCSLSFDYFFIFCNCILCLFWGK